MLSKTSIFQNASAINDSIWTVGPATSADNYSGYNDTNYHPVYELPIWKQLFWFTLFGGMVSNKNGSLLA